MAIIVVGTNSWTTLLEANNYLSHKPDCEEWFELSDTPTSSGKESKEGYLIDAFYRLLYSDQYSLVATLTSDIIKHAQIEFALFLFQNYEDYKERESKIAGGIKSFSYSKWKESLDSSIKFPNIVNSILKKAGYGSANFLQEITVD